MSETSIHHQEKLKAHTDTLDEAKRVFYDIAGEVDDKYIDRGIDLDNVPKEEYWMAVAQTANRRSREQYSTPDRLELGAALELTAALPYFLLAQQKLREQEQPLAPLMSRDEREAKVYYTSYFNGVLRSYTTARPSISASEVKDHLLGVAEQSDLDQNTGRMQRQITDLVKGAQHELAAGQILRKLGTIREATTEEDLQGIDYVMQYLDKCFGVDIKATLMTLGLKSGEHEQAAAINRGKLMLYSHIMDRELQDRFFISEQAAERKASLVADSIYKLMRDPGLRLMRFE